MTDRRQATPRRPAFDQAVELMQAVRDNWGPLPVPPGWELDAIPADLLHRVADERRMAGERS